MADASAADSESQGECTTDARVGCFSRGRRARFTHGNPIQGGFDPSRSWEPFDSEVDFLLARFMVRFGVSEGAIDFLLKTILPCLGVHHAVRSVYAVKERIGRMEDGLGHQSFLGSALHAIEGFQSRRACRTISTHLAPGENQFVPSTLAADREWERLGRCPCTGVVSGWPSQSFLWS
jgi:hypothetical protein